MCLEMLLVTRFATRHGVLTGRAHALGSGEIKIEAAACLECKRALLECIDGAVCHIDITIRIKYKNGTMDVVAARVTSGQLPVLTVST